MTFHDSGKSSRSDVNNGLSLRKTDLVEESENVENYNEIFM